MPKLLQDGLQALTLLCACLLSTAVFAFGSNSSAFGNNSAFSGAQAEPDFLKVDQAFVFTEEIVAGGIKLNWQVTEGYYLYLERFKFKSLSPEATQNTLGEPQFSTQGKLEQDPYFGEVHIIEQDVSVFLPVDLQGLSESELKISYQGCAKAGLCYPPTHKRVMYIPVTDGSSNKPSAPIDAEMTDHGLAAKATGAAGTQASQATNLDNASGIFDFIQGASLASLISIFFLLGLGLTFTPCVFPMVPIISSIIAGQAKPSPSRSFTLALAYVLGMAITYAAAGVVTGLLGAGANVQAAMQNPYVLGVFAAIFVILAMAMFGLFELQLPAFIRDRLNTQSQNLSGGQLGSVFVIGAFSALVVSPCVSAPLAGALIYISATGDAFIGGLSLFAMGLGMGVPLIAVAVGGGKLFPKAGKWMDSVKAVFGVMLLAVAIWLISRFAPGPVNLVLWALLFCLSGVQMGAFDSAKAGWPRLFKGLGLVLTFYAALLLIGAASGGSNPLKPLASLQLSTSTGISSTAPSTQKLPFKAANSLSELEQRLATQNTRVSMLDFYADWCISCIVMENEVFPLPKVNSQLRQMNLLKADVTDNNAEHKALMEHFDLFGPPSILFFDAQGKELSSLRIVGEISAENFEQHLARVLAHNS